MRSSSIQRLHLASRQRGDGLILPMPFVHIVKPGLQTTVQDGGGGVCNRTACRSPDRWIPARTASPMRWSATTATTAALEITFVGPELEFEDERLVAVAGAEFAMSLDGVAVRSRTPRSSPAPDRGCALARASAGRARYLAIAGGVAVAAGLGEPRHASRQPAWAASKAAR